MGEKPIVWVASTLTDLRLFPDDARRHAGYELRRVQSGRDPSDWKPVTAVGPGVREIRIHLDRAFRVLYVAKFPEALYVLHVFEKRSQQITRADLSVARDRYRALLIHRRTDRGPG